MFIYPNRVVTIGIDTFSGDFLDFHLQSCFLELSIFLYKEKVYNTLLDENILVI